MKTFLLAYNGDSETDAEHLAKAAHKIKAGRGAKFQWSFGKSKKAQRGDRVFLIKLGRSPKGLIGSGRVVAPPRLGKDHQFYANIDWDHLDDIENNGTVTVPRDDLRKAPFSKQHWDVQMSGISIKTDVAQALDRLWGERTGGSGAKGRKNHGTTDITEGSRSQSLVDKYERNEEARKKCVEHFGFACSACGIVLEKIYGDIGEILCTSII